eukprot:6592616-Prymnesium_polylepis.1
MTRQSTHIETHIVRPSLSSVWSCFSLYALRAPLSAFDFARSHDRTADARTALVLHIYPPQHPATHVGAHWPAASIRGRVAASLSTFSAITRERLR